METTTMAANTRMESVKNGLGLGLITLVLGIITGYILMGTSSMLTIAAVPITLGVIIPIVIAVFFCKDLRKKAGGFWTFRQAVSAIFLMFLISWVVSTAGSLIYNKFIEPDMQSRIQERIVSTTTTMMKNNGVEEAEIDKMEAKMTEDFNKANDGTIMKTIQGYLIGLVLIFVIALIFAAIFKKEPPMYMEGDEPFVPAE